MLEEYSPLEIAIGNLYAEFYRLRKDGKLQEELEAMECLHTMLLKDMQFLRQKINNSKEE